ncbi:MAG: hypothetical protein ACJAVV_002485 [Alphaproteobacteria bacterium]|jgi:hypothetical protein
MHKSILKILTPGLFIVFHLCAFSVIAKDTSIFTQHTISLPFSVNQSVLAADILAEDGVELIVVGIDAEQQRTLAIYGFDETLSEFVKRDQIAIANNMFAFDVGEKKIDGLQSLYFLSKSEVQRYIPAHFSHEATLKTVELVSSMYLSEISDSFVHKDFVKDVNDDGLDDIVLPHFEQVNLWLSDCCGLRHPQSLSIPARLEVYESSVVYDDAKLYFQDMDQDGTTDIVKVEHGKLLVYSQNENMQFSSQATIIDISASIYAIAWWDIKDLNGQELDQSNLMHRRLTSIKDINGDKIPDITVEFTKSSGVLDKTIDYEFYYGDVTQRKLSYSTQANASVTSEDTLDGLQFLDLEEDGIQEVMVSSFDIGISQIIGAILSGGIDQDVMIFSMDSENQFGKKPMIKKEVEITFSLSSGTSGQPLIKVADINGDKIKDLIFSDGADKIKVTLATPKGKRPYARKALKQNVVLPKNASQIAEHDLNSDNKADLILHYGRADGPELLKQITVLLAN